MQKRKHLLFVLGGLNKFLWLPITDSSTNEQPPLSGFTAEISKSKAIALENCQLEPDLIKSSKWRCCS